MAKKTTAKKKTTKKKAPAKKTTRKKVAKKKATKKAATKSKTEKKPTPKGAYLSVSACAERKGVSQRTITKAITGGDLPAILLVDANGNVTARGVKPADLKGWRPKIDAKTRERMAEGQRRRHGTSTQKTGTTTRKKAAKKKAPAKRKVTKKKATKKPATTNATTATK